MLKMKMVSLIIFLILCTALVSAKNVIKEECEYNSKKTQYDDGTTTLTLGVDYYSNKNCKLMRNEKSLKDCEFCDKFKMNLQEDILNFPVIVNDWNWTHIDVCLSINDYWKNQQIPLLIYNKTNSSEILIDTTLKLRSSLDGKCYIFPIGLNYEIKWGTQSTTISLNVGNNDILEDTTIYSTDPTLQQGLSSLIFKLATSAGSTRYPMIKWNLTKIPSNSIILDSKLYLYIVINSLDDADEFEMLRAASFCLPYNMNGYDWDEGSNVSLTQGDYNDMTWGNYTFCVQNISSDEQYIWGGAGEPTTTYISWNITNAVQANLIYRNISLIIINTSFGAQETTDYIYFRSKDYSSDWPYLNITYMAAAESTPPSITIYPVNFTKTNTTIGWNITLSESSNISGTYGKLPSHTDVGTFANATLATLFRFNFSGLINNTAYGFNVTRMCDAIPNCNTTGYNFSFTTAQTPSGASPCPYTAVDCSTLHAISDNCDNQNNNITFSGAGNLVVSGTIYNIDSYTVEDCKLIITSGKLITS